MRIGVDLDGTIITCREKHCSLMSSLTRASNINFCKDKYWLDKRSGLNNKNSLLNQGVSLELSEKINSYWLSNIENYEWASFDSLIIGVLDSFRKIRNKGHSLHLISARNNIYNARLQLDTLGISFLFDSIDFTTIFSKKKKSFYFKERKIECYIGDTELDFEECKTSNILYYPVITGMRSKEFFTSLGLGERINLSINHVLEKI